MKVRKKSTEAVEAIRVKFGTSAWPGWLAGHLNIKGNESRRAIEDGGYLVRDGDDVKYCTPDEFADRYDRVRLTKNKENNE